MHLTDMDPHVLSWSLHCFGPILKRSARGQPHILRSSSDSSIPSDVSERISLATQERRGQGAKPDKLQGEKSQPAVHPSLDRALFLSKCRPLRAHQLSVSFLRSDLILPSANLMVCVCACVRVSVYICDQRVKKKKKEVHLRFFSPTMSHCLGLLACLFAFIPLPQWPLPLPGPHHHASASCAQKRGAGWHLGAAVGRVGAVYISWGGGQM